MAEADSNRNREVDTEPLLGDATSSQSCPICREELGSSAKLECHGCRQLYHYSCYHRHLQSSSNRGCPCCRYGEVRPADENQQANQEPNQQLPVNPNHVLPMFFINQNTRESGLTRQNPHIDPRVERYISLSCASYCYLFLLIATFPISSFVYWPYSILIWLACWSGLAFGIYKLGFRDIRMLLYASFCFGALAMIFASILYVHPEIIWATLFSICAGGELGTIHMVFRELYILKIELRQEGLLP